MNPQLRASAITLARIIAAIRMAVLGNKERRDLMRVEKAKKHYLDRTGPKKMNCCESVVYAFQDEIPLSEEELQKCAGFGGGQAPEGYCGAIYAAKRLLEVSGSEKAVSLQEIFKEIAGSAKCREIKAIKKISCLECVTKAAEIVEGR